MRLETFSYLPPLDERASAAQIESILDRGLVVAIEHAPAPGPRLDYWSLWELPLFGVHDAGRVLAAIDDCRRAHPGSYIRVNGYDARRQGQVASFVVHRPGAEAA